MGRGKKQKTKPLLLLSSFLSKHDSDRARLSIDLNVRTTVGLVSMPEGELNERETSLASKLAPENPEKRAGRGGGSG
jgi:hypothetical protein